MLEHEGVDGDRRALSGPVTVVEVVEVSAQALVEDVGATERKRAIATDRESGGEEGTSLRGSVKLELVVCGDVPGASLCVMKNAVGKSKRKGGVAGTGNHDSSARRAGPRGGR